MMPIDILMLTILCVLFGVAFYMGHLANRDLQEMKSWWADYNARLDELNRRLEETTKESPLSLFPESGEVAKQPCTEGDMSTHVDRDNVFFLKAENEEQQ